MSTDGPGESPLAAVLGDAEGHTVDAFSLLADETRLSILIVLYEHSEGGPVAFSTLRETVGLRDSGQFNYHIGQLTGQYLRRTDQGYELTNAGNRIVRTVLAWTRHDDVAFGPTAVDGACPFCGAGLEIAYGDERVFVSCSSCPGGGPRIENNVIVGSFPPAGAREGDPQAVFERAFAYLTIYITQAMLAGVCLLCGGAVDSQLVACEDHDVEGICDACEMPFLGTIECQCTTCGAPNIAPSWTSAISDPRVIGHLHDRGIDHDPTSWAGFMQRGVACRETLVATDPTRMAIEVPAGEETIGVTIDETGAVVEVDPP